MQPPKRGIAAAGRATDDPLPTLERPAALRTRARLGLPNPATLRRGLLEHAAPSAFLSPLRRIGGGCPRSARRVSTFDDGHALYQAVCDQGLEGVVAKRSASTYRPGQRGWVKVKNPGYWRREQEIAAVKRSLERRPTAL
jgi:ATP-dependent DNA ligase